MWLCIALNVFTVLLQTSRSEHVVQDLNKYDVDSTVESLGDDLYDAFNGFQGASSTHAWINSIQGHQHSAPPVFTYPVNEPAPLSKEQAESHRTDARAQIPMDARHQVLNPGLVHNDIKESFGLSEALPSTRLTDGQPLTESEREAAAFVTASAEQIPLPHFPPNVGEPQADVTVVVDATAPGLSETEKEALAFEDALQSPTLPPTPGPSSVPVKMEQIQSAPIAKDAAHPQLRSAGPECTRATLLTKPGCPTACKAWDYGFCCGPGQWKLHFVHGKLPSWVPQTAEETSISIKRLMARDKEAKAGTKEAKYKNAPKAFGISPVMARFMQSEMDLAEAAGQSPQMSQQVLPTTMERWQSQESGNSRRTLGISPALAKFIQSETVLQESASQSPQSDEEGTPPAPTVVKPWKLPEEEELRRNSVAKTRERDKKKGSDEILSSTAKEKYQDSQKAGAENEKTMKVWNEQRAGKENSVKKNELDKAIKGSEKMKAAAEGRSTEGKQKQDMLFSTIPKETKDRVKRIDNNGPAMTEGLSSLPAMKEARLKREDAKKPKVHNPVNSSETAAKVQESEIQAKKMAKKEADLTEMMKRIRFECNGNQQSPININTTTSTQEKSPQAHLKFFYVAARLNAVGMNTTQYFLQVSPGPEGVPAIAVGDEKYNIEKVWLKSSSEHSIAGRRYALELQYQHRSPSRPQRQAFISAMYETETLDPHTNEFLDDLNIENKTVNLLDGLPMQSQYFNYRGSETSPPCSQDVEWFVFSKPISMPLKQMQRIRQVMSLDQQNTLVPLDASVSAEYIAKNCCKAPCGSNARPIQRRDEPLPLVSGQCTQYFGPRQFVCDSDSTDPQADELLSFV